ncbi:MAG TPA: periplasmic heavy metal sensor [Polyangia bacterium]|nr:periplasmic heavy metal sensor [Polyangia bacterium]
MIGCLIFGGLAAMGVARAIHHRRMVMGWGGGGCHGRWHHGWHGHGPGWHGFPGGWGRYDEEPVEMGGGPSPEAGWGGGWGGDGFPGFGGRMRKRFVVRAVLEHVRATPAQERVIGAAFEEFRDEMKRVSGGEGRRTRQEIVDALRRPTFDGVVLGEQFARHDTVLEAARKSFVGLVAKIHDALEPEQRDRLAELIERGPRSFAGFRRW